MANGWQSCIANNQDYDLQKLIVQNENWATKRVTNEQRMRKKMLGWVAYLE